ncbi:MAG: 4-alpha-glucanotransferase, partial [Oscillospiraceae bacterium]
GVSVLAVTTAQDLLLLPSSARMNTPGTVGNQNWGWRMTDMVPDAEVKVRLRRLNQLYYR